jgi:hypothetical protein
MKLILLFLSVIAYTAITSSPITTTQFIKIDQFGYRNNDQKIAVLSDPQVGYNAALSFTPGNEYQIRDWNTDAVAFTGSPVVWNNGTTHDQSGDKVSFSISLDFKMTKYSGFDQIEGFNRYSLEYGPVLLGLSGKFNFKNLCIRILNNPSEI